MDGSADVTAALRAAGELESLLRARGAVGPGLGALVRSMGDDLPVELRSRLLALGVIRNKFAHTPDALPREHLERFIHEVGDVKEHLLALAGETPPDAELLSSVWLTQQLRERDAQVSFSPPPSPPPPPRLDLRVLDREGQRAAQRRQLAQVVVFVVAALAFLYLLTHL